MWLALQIIGGALVGLVAVFALWAFGSKSGRRSRALINLPVLPIDGLVQGQLAKFVGRVAIGPNGPIVAPVCRLPVVAYQGFLGFWSPGLGTRHMSFRQSTSFVLETVDGDVLVEAEQAVFDVSLGETSRIEWADAAEWMDEMVTRDGLQFDRQAPKADRVGHYQMAEAFIAAGTAIAVLGVAARDANGTIVVRADPQLGMALTTDPDIARLANA